MRSRVIDIALLLGLVAVAGAIMWTLFNLGGTPRSTQPPPTPAREAQPVPGTEGGRVVPVAPGAPGDEAAPGDGAPGDGAPGGAAAIAEPSADDPDADGGAPEAPAAAAPPAAAPAVPGQPPGGAEAAATVPGGTVDLERIGFSFVTGGPGACGVVLEAWTHVAVSRDLLAAYGCGARVRVTLADAAGDRSSFEGVVGDTMNPQFARTVNVYVGEDEPAFEYGLTSGTITPLD
jgi:hypothetical protein